MSLLSAVEKGKPSSISRSLTSRILESNWGHLGAPDWAATASCLLGPLCPGPGWEHVHSPQTHSDNCLFPLQSAAVTVLLQIKRLWGLSCFLFFSKGLAHPEILDTKHSLCPLPEPQSQCLMDQNYPSSFLSPPETSLFFHQAQAL